MRRVTVGITDHATDSAWGADAIIDLLAAHITEDLGVHRFTSMGIADFIVSIQTVRSVMAWEASVRR
jgi:hypothetical protein